MREEMVETRSAAELVEKWHIDSVKRILIVKLSAIGDVLMATPVAKALREAFPDSYIAWVVEKKAADIVIGNPYLDEVIVWDRTRGQNPLSRVLNFTTGLWILRKQLRARNFEVCLDLQGLLRSAIVCWLSGAARRIGFADGAEGSVLFYNEKYKPGDSIPSAQQRNLDLLKKLGVTSTDAVMYMPLTESDRIFAARFFENHRLQGKRTVAFCPATTWANKHWTIEGWSALADMLSDKHEVHSIILGSSADVPLAREIARRCKTQPIIAAGHTTLKQAGAIIEKCNAVVGVDTGLLHMSVALDKPTVGLFGASAWRCFPRKDNFVWVAKEFPCSPCLRHPTCKNTDCMRAITPEDVEQALRAWFE